MGGAASTLAVVGAPGLAGAVRRGQRVGLGVGIDGAMPRRAVTLRGCGRGVHQVWLAQQARERNGHTETANATVEIRYRYNPDVKSLPAMVPAVIPILLLMLPAMLAALSVVREKELGSIINLYVTPVTKTEFLLGKQIPYILLAMLNFFLMTFLAVTAFDVPVKGSFLTLTLGAFIYCLIATGFGLLASTFTLSQIAAMFFTMIGTMMPAIQFSGMINSTSSLEGLGKLVGEIYPTTHMLIISRGVFNKALSFGDLYSSFLVLLITFPIILAASVAFLKKQEK